MCLGGYDWLIRKINKWVYNRKGVMVDILVSVHFLGVGVCAGRTDTPSQRTDLQHERAQAYTKSENESIHGNYSGHKNTENGTAKRSTGESTNSRIWSIIGHNSVCVKSTI